MKLADKIFKLRKQAGLSQEQLAEKIDVSRQSVSKWESGNSTPDINKIILLADIFQVSTDYLLKDDIDKEIENDIEQEKVQEEVQEKKQGRVGEMDTSIDMIKRKACSETYTLETVNEFINHKIKASRLTAIGLVLVLCSPVPFFIMLALQSTDFLYISSNVGSALGLLGLFLMIAVGVSYFIKSNAYPSTLEKGESGNLLLDNEAEAMVKSSLEAMKENYHQRISISIFAFIFSFVPLILVSLLFPYRFLEYGMVAVLFILITAGVVNLVLTSTRYNVYMMLAKEGQFSPSKIEGYSFTMKIGLIYLSVVTAVYLGWSFYTMDWGTTWIIWPVAAVLLGLALGILKLIKDRK